MSMMAKILFGNNEEIEEKQMEKIRREIEDLNFELQIMEANREKRRKQK
jgi:hypothetical protein